MIACAKPSRIELAFGRSDYFFPVGFVCPVCELPEPAGVLAPGAGAG
jgi:hypothetical protein